MSGLYPAEIRDNLVYSNCSDKWVVNINFANRALKSTIQDTLHSIKLGCMYDNIERCQSSGRIHESHFNYADKIADSKLTRNSQITQCKQRQLADVLNNWQISRFITKEILC